MNPAPPDKPAAGASETPLNPSLKASHDDSYGADQSGTDPMASVSVPEHQKSVWPMVWAVSTIVCVVITLLLVLF